MRRRSIEIAIAGMILIFGLVPRPASAQSTIAEQQRSEDRDTRARHDVSSSIM